MITSYGAKIRISKRKNKNILVFPNGSNFGGANVVQIERISNFQIAYPAWALMILYPPIRLFLFWLTFFRLFGSFICRIFATDNHKNNETMKKNVFISVCATADDSHGTI